MLTKENILEKLPYDHPFLFVDEIESMNEERITGNYTFRSNSWFYEGHFKGNPVTPGVILTECCAQIGLAIFGIYLLGDSNINNPRLAMTSSEMEFVKPVYPGEKVNVVAEKQYFRFNKLKCRVKMLDSEKDLVCKGQIAGMLVNSRHEE